MYPGTYAKEMPDKAAAIDAVSGRALTYRQLDEQSAQLARYLTSVGLQRGDTLAINLENRLEFFVATWAALRSGLYLVTVNRFLPAHDVAYILSDSGAKAVIMSGYLKDVACDLLPRIPDCPHRLMIEGEVAGWFSYEDALTGQSTSTLDDERAGDHMPYSSGTTGKPKGIRRELVERNIADEPPFLDSFRAYGFDGDTVYLSPAPLYHAAPFSFTNRTQVLGGTVVMMPRFNALESLRLIEKYKVTHSQWVPTMFIRMLALGDEIKSRYDQSSLKCVIHAAAPCPIDVKLEMIKWWGEIIWEYYGASEGNGLTVIDSKEWLRHRGSVGKAKIGKVRICGDDGEELPRGETGLIYFSDSPKFEYHNDPQKTKDSRNQYGWSTLGDIGYLDSDDYLYLTDRKANTIISGGVNIYPQEIENHLLGHPAVKDVAVIGAPNNEFGEEVKAVVIPIQKSFEQDDLERELIEFCLIKVGKIKSPKSVDFVEELPRQENGKLYKRLLKDRYWKNER